MSDDYSGGSVTDVTTTGFLSGLMGSVVGVLIGLVLIVGGLVLLWWNEGRAVAAIQALDAGARAVVEIAATPVDPATNGKLVHVSGTMATDAPARDPVFGVGGDGALRLSRTVEMYAWTEHKSTSQHKNLGGSETTETTYSYRKEWSSPPADSGHFREPNGHRNPPLAIRSTIVDSRSVKLGAYRVESGLLAEVSAFADLAPTDAATPPEGYHRSGDYFYRGGNADDPAVGDTRVSYRAVTAQPYSVVARQVGDALAPYEGAGGYRIALAKPGTVPAAAMFRAKEHEESLLTWALRLVGFVLLLVGFVLLGGLLTALAGIVPMLGDIVGTGVFLVALMLAVPLTLLTIALAWIIHRPLLGGGLIVAGLVLAFLIRRLRRRPSRPLATAAR